MPLHLEPLSPEHLPHVMTWVNDREVMQYFANRQTDINQSDEAAYLEGLIASKQERVYSIFDDEVYVGQVSLNQIYWPAKNARLFVVVRRELQGRGYGTSAVERIVERAFGELGLRKIWLIVRKDNRHAQAMYLKLGFDFEKIGRAHV